VGPSIYLVWLMAPTGRGDCS